MMIMIQQKKIYLGKIQTEQEAHREEKIKLIQLDF